MIGTNVRETFAYTLTMRNTRKEPVTLVLQDQQPISNENEIVVEDRDLGNAVYNDVTGLMNWNVTLAPNESKSINFGYTVKYPKGKTVSGL